MNNKIFYLKTLLIITWVHLLICSSIWAQQIKTPVKKEETKNKTSLTTPNETFSEKQTLKISPSHKCTIKIDGESKGVVDAGDVLKVGLIKGIYLIEAICTENNKAKWREDYTVDEINVEKLKRIDLTDLLILANKERDQTEQQNKEKQKSATEQTAWNNANKMGTLAAYQNYLSQYPDGINALPAKIKIDEISWNDAIKLNTLEAYKKYVSDFPNGTNNKTAKEKIKVYEDEANYKKFRQSGDDYFNNKNWKDAASNFNQALTYKNDDPYVKGKLSIANDSINLVEKTARITYLQEQIKTQKKSNRTTFLIAIPLAVISTVGTIAGFATIASGDGGIGLTVVSVTFASISLVAINVGSQGRKKVKIMKEELETLQRK